MRGRRRSSWWSRAAEWFAVAWAVVALVTPAAFPTLVALAAPGHGAAAQGSAHAAGMPCAEGMHAAAGMPARPVALPSAATHAPRAAGAHRGAPSNDHRCCTCFGPCCHAAPAVFARAPLAPEIRVVVVRPRPAATARLLLYYPTAPEHARPPSVGPPVGLSV